MVLSPLAGAQTPTRIIVYPPGSVARSNTPIFLPGHGGVTDTGEASYTIPLWVPDGPQDMQPSLTIAYGGRGNGLVGAGFGLSGLSAITPCAKTFASEGYADNADFGIGELAEQGHDDTSGDAYCLDGKKLVEFTVDGFQMPGDALQSYHTEIESFEHVVAHRNVSTVNGPTRQPGKFSVYSRDGSVRTYMPVYGPRVEVADAMAPPISSVAVAVAYLITESRDRNWNRIRYTYAAVAANGELSYRPATIDYSFTGTGTPRRQIKFEYQSRPDPIVRYIRGVKVVSSVRISRIDAYAPNPDSVQRVWSYNLGYEPSPDTGRSLLSSVQLCEQSGACSWVRSFKWTSSKGVLTSEKDVGEAEFDSVSLGYHEDVIADYRATDKNWLKPNDTRVMLFDIDGDGDDDALYRTHPSWVQARFDYWDGWFTNAWMVRYFGRIGVRLSGMTEPLTMKRIYIQNLLEPGFHATNPDYPGIGDTISSVNLGKSRVADLDGDGSLDLSLARMQFTITADSPSDAFGFRYLHRWKYGYTSYLGAPWDHVNDRPFDTAVTDEVHTSVLTGPVMRYKTQVGAEQSLVAEPPFQRVLADLDGDGRVEPVGSIGENGAGALDVMTSPGSSDWNHPDAAAVGGFPYVGMVSSDASLVAFSALWSCGNGNALVTDLDGDGRQDVLVRGDTSSPQPEIDPITGSPGTYKRLTLSDPFWGIPTHGNAAISGTSKLWAGDCNGAQPDLVMGDWNGDGLSDALYPPGSYGNNTQPLVRWNLGTGGFGPREVMGVEGAPGITALMEQKVPIGKLGTPVRWDRGTRVADVDGDGRSDIIAVRQDNAVCVDALLASPFTPPTIACKNKVVVFRSRGDKFFGEEIHTWDHAMATLTHGFTTFQVGDVNGDGSPEAVHVADGKLRTLELPWRTTPDLLLSVHDGSASFTLDSFAYTRAWWGDAPRREATAEDPVGPTPCAWPIACRNGGFNVVRKHRTFTGTDASGSPMHRHMIHTFAGPKTSLIGRGNLGFASHHIWDRERGRMTTRTFDNGRLVDPNPSAPGGKFYPYAGVATLEVTTTPRRPVPSAAELSSNSAAPGLEPFTPIDVRTTWSSTMYTMTHSPNGRLLKMLPTRTEVKDVENTGQPNPDSQTPSYGVGSPFGEGRITTTTATPDDFGNVREKRTEINDGAGWGPVAVRTQNATYDNRVATWQLGLATVIEQRSSAPAQSYTPSRVMRIGYDAAGNQKTVAHSATGPTYQTCIDLGGSAVGCETKGARTKFLIRDTRGNARVIHVEGTDVTTRAHEIDWDNDGVYPARSRDSHGNETTTLVHPAIGVPVRVTDINNITSLATYDGFGRLLSSTREGAASLQRTYTQVNTGNRRGLRINDVRGDGTQSYRVTDELGRTVELGRRGFDNQWTYGQHQYDLYGNLVRSAKPAWSLTSPKWTESSFNRLGEVLLVTTPDQRSTIYEPRIRRSKAFDPEGHLSYLERDAAGRPVESGHLLADDSKLGEVKFTYGPFDQVDRVIDAAGNTAAIGRDAFGRITVESHPDSGTTAFRYDALGQPIYQKDANGDIYTRTYDALGRVLETDGPDGTTTRTYDVGVGAAGKLTSVTSFQATDDVTTAFTYDVYGRTSTIKQTVGTAVDEIVHRYDGLGRLKFLFYPQSPNNPRFAVWYKWGADGFVHAINDVSVCGFVPVPGPTAGDPSCIGSELWRANSRDASLQLTSATYGSSMNETRAYHPETGRIERLTTPHQDTSYLYNDDGLLSDRIEVSIDRAEHFEYDDLHRLTSWSLRTPKNRDGVQKTTDTGYVYDELGNLLEVLTNDVPSYKATYGWSGRPHALLWNSEAGTAFQYDKAGRQTRSAGRTIAYNGFDLPTTITTNGVDRDFLYDGNGGRALRSDPTSKIRYLGRFFEHRDQTSSTDVFYVYGDPGLVAQVEYKGVAKRVRYVVGDPIGNTSAVMRSTGALDERDYYDPFGARVDVNGQRITDVDPSTSRGFTGHEDDGNGLVHMQGRMYDRNQYRFLTPDPVIAEPLFGQAYNPYSYVFNNPLNLTDPSGFQAQAADSPPVTEAGTYTSDEKGGESGEFQHTEIHGNRSEAGDSDDATIGSDRGHNAGATRSAPPARAPIPNVEKRTAWRPTGPATDVTKMAGEHAMDSNSSYLSRIAAASGALIILPFALGEQAAAELIAAPQEVVNSFDAYRQHHQRALSLEAVGANSAATDEWLGMAQEGLLGISGLASLIADFSPASIGAKVEHVAEHADDAVQRILRMVDTSAPGQTHAFTPTTVDPADVAQWSAKANANAYRSTTQQYLYAVLDADGNAIKWGTTLHENVANRYGGKIEETFGKGATIERVATGSTRYIRHLEREMIRRHRWQHGARPKFNKADH